MIGLGSDKTMAMAVKANPYHGACVNFLELTCVGYLQLKNIQFISPNFAFWWMVVEKAGSHMRFLTGPNCVQDFAHVDTSADEDHGDRDDDRENAGSRLRVGKFY